jgi:DDE superfamily endonuclease
LICVILSRPRNYKELFNFRHAQLRNVIERIFGVMKRRFRVLLLAQEYSIETQVQLVSALTVVHNFIRLYDPRDKELNTTHIPQETSSTDSEIMRPPADDRGNASRRREDIARAMWRDYEARSRRR